MLRMRRQTRIADAADRRMYGQPTGEFARGLLSLTQANGESAGAAQGEEALEGARGGAGDLAAANQSGVISRVRHTTTPRSRSEWPPMNLVALCTM